LPIRHSVSTPRTNALRKSLPDTDCISDSARIARRVDDGLQVGVVEVEDMARHAVDEGGVHEWRERRATAISTV
jgi:hypothetical protein